MQANGFLNFKIRYFADKLKFFIQIRYCWHLGKCFHQKS
jgi:hypothetical protein